MLNRLVVTLALTTLSFNSFAMATVNTYLAECTSTRTLLDNETKLPVTTIVKSIEEDQSYLNFDETEETLIYKILSTTIDGEEYATSDSENGIVKILTKKISDTETQITFEDTSEYLVEDENGKIQSAEKDTIVSDAVWKTLEESDEKIVKLRVSHKRNGVEDKEQILYTKMIKSESEYAISRVTLNPQDIVRSDGQLLSQSRLCYVKKIK